MNDQSVLLNDIADFLWSELACDRYPETEQGGIYQAFNQPVRRLGLALEPFPELTSWVADNQLDAVWLHRPWQLDLATLPADMGILYNHLPFDEHLTMGHNPRLASRLQATGLLEPLGFKQAVHATGALLPQRPIGMVFDAVPQDVVGWVHQVETMFGGYDQIELGRQSTIGRVAVVGAMNDALIREAADRGVGLYLTGQYRTSAQKAVDETGMVVVAVGHRRSEEWGLQALADVLRERWPALDVKIINKQF